MDGTHRTAPQKEPKQARAHKRRQAILDAAHKLVIAEGCAHVTTTAVAEKAAIPVGSVYRYFTDRAAILKELHKQAYASVMAPVWQQLESISGHAPFQAVQRDLLACFWREAKHHPTFQALTRWANADGSLWDVTPGTDTDLYRLVETLAQKTQLTLPPARAAFMIRTVTTTLSVLIDQAIEAEQEEDAVALLNEITLLFESYFTAAEKDV